MSSSAHDGRYYTTRPVVPQPAGTALMPCPNCDGTGRVDYARDATHHDWAPCEECRGTGAARCDTCWEPHASHRDAAGKPCCDACSVEFLVPERDTMPATPPSIDVEQEVARLTEDTNERWTVYEPFTFRDGVRNAWVTYEGDRAANEWRCVGVRDVAAPTPAPPPEFPERCPKGHRQLWLGDRWEVCRTCAREDTVPAPPPDADDEAELVAGLAESAAVVEDARAAGIDPREAFGVVRAAVKVTATRRRARRAEGGGR